MPRPAARVCMLGAESTGKTTLAAALAQAYGTVWNPEYGRVYTVLGRPPDAPWTSAEFVHIARVHCWYEDFLAGFATRVLFTDTDAFTTAVFHEAYLGEPAQGFEELVARRYDLYLVCGVEVSSPTLGDAITRSTSSTPVRAGPRGSSSKGRPTSAWPLHAPPSTHSCKSGARARADAGRRPARLLLVSPRDMSERAPCAWATDLLPTLPF
jgi:nicotinamide riboside kinase